MLGPSLPERHRKLLDIADRQDRLLREMLSFIAGRGTSQQVAQHNPAQTKRPAQRRDGVRQVLAELYPDGVPDQATLPNTDLCKAVGKHVPFDVSISTILRAAGRK
jgi:hypothetical protein